MPAAVQLRSMPPPRSPEREQLAEAIARHDAATQRLAHILAVQEQSSGAALEARIAVRKATGVLDEAKANEASYLAAVALGEADAANSPAKVAARAVEEAEATLDLARRTSAALGEEEKAAASDLQRAKSKLDDAVADVMKASVPVADLLRDAEAVQADLVNRRIVLRHLLHAGWVAEPEAAAVSSFLFRYGDALPGTYLNLISQDWDVHPGAAAWRDAAATLLRNADAPLPQG